MAKELENFYASRFRVAKYRVLFLRFLEKQKSIFAALRIVLLRRPRAAAARRLARFIANGSNLFFYWFFMTPSSSETICAMAIAGKQSLDYQVCILRTQRAAF